MRRKVWEKGGLVNVLLQQELCGFVRHKGRAIVGVEVAEWSVLGDKFL